MTNTHIHQEEILINQQLLNNTFTDNSCSVTTNIDQPDTFMTNTPIHQGEILIHDKCSTTHSPTTHVH